MKYHLSKNIDVIEGVRFGICFDIHEKGSAIKFHSVATLILMFWFKALCIGLNRP